MTRAIFCRAIGPDGVVPDGNTVTIFLVVISLELLQTTVYCVFDSVLFSAAVCLEYVCA